MTDREKVKKFVDEAAVRMNKMKAFDLAATKFKTSRTSIKNLYYESQGQEKIGKHKWVPYTSVVQINDIFKVQREALDTMGISHRIRVDGKQCQLEIMEKDWDAIWDDKAYLNGCKIKTTD